MIVFAESWFDRRFLNLSLSKRTQAAFPAKCKPISRQADAQRYWSGCGALIAQSDRYSWVDRWPFQSNFSSSRGSCRSWWTWVLCSCGVWWSVRPLDPTGTWRVCYWCLHDLQCSPLRLARLSRDDQHRLEWIKPLAICHGCKEPVLVWIQSTIRSSNPCSCIWRPWVNGYEHCVEARRCRVKEVDSADLAMMASQVLWKRSQILKEHLDDANVIWCLRKLEILAWDHILYVKTL